MVILGLHDPLRNFPETLTLSLSPSPSISFILEHFMDFWAYLSSFIESWRSRSSSSDTKGGGFKFGSNKVTSFLDLCEYKVPNLLFGLLDIVSGYIYHRLVHFVYDLRVEMTPTPFDHLGMLYRHFRLGNLILCACPLSHASYLVL